MKKIIIIITLLLVPALTVFAAAFNSKQVGSDPVSGYILQTNGEISSWISTSSILQWTTNGSDIYYNTGNVGIGDSTPSVKLDVKGSISAVSSSYPVLGFERTTSATGGSFGTLTGIASAMKLLTTSTGDITDGFGGGIIFSGGDDTFSPTDAQSLARIYARRDGADTEGALQFLAGTNGTEPVMILRSSGNVGIGTTSPEQRLDIAGTGLQTLQLYNTTAQTVASDLTSILFKANSATSGVHRSGQILSRSIGSTRIGYMDFQTGFADTLTTVMTLTAVSGGGNVGIGTTSPTAKFEVYGSGFSSSQSLIKAFRDNGGILADIEDTGWSGKLQILTQSANDIFFKAGSGDSLSFATNNSSTASLYINSTGNVGIGTTTPSSKLTVSGDAYITATTTMVNATANYLTVKNLLTLGNTVNEAGHMRFYEPIYGYYSDIYTNEATGGLVFNTSSSGGGAAFTIGDTGKFSVQDSVGDMFNVDINNGMIDAFMPFHVNSSLLDSTASAGTDGLVLTSTGTSTLWTTGLSIDGSEIAYVSATGNDATAKKNSTTLQFATLNAAISAIGNNGTVYVGPGIFTGEVVDLANVSNLKIIGSQNGRTIFRFGSAYTSFTNVSGITWRAPLQEVITYTDTANPASVQQLGTSYGAITNHHPVDRGAAYRMQNTPLEYQTSTTTVGGGNGRWSFDSEYFYVSKTDGGNPNGATYMVSDQDIGQSFVYNGTDHLTGNLEIHNIEVQFAYDGFNLKNVANAKLTKVIVQGSTNNGIFGYDNGTVELLNPEISDVGNDAINFKGTETGATSTTSPNYRKPYITIFDPYVHDSFDKGIVAHERTTVFIRGGLVESAPLTIIGMAGVMAFAGGNIHADGVTVRGYTASEAFSVAGSVSAYEGSDGIYMRVQNSVVENSRIGFRNQSTGKLVVYDSTVVGNTLAACYGGSSTQYVECNNVVSIGNGGLLGNAFANASCIGCTAYTTASPEGVIAAATGTMAYVNSGSPVASVYVKRDSSALTTGWKRVDWASSTQVTNGINYYNGTDIVSNSNLVFNSSGNVGIGTSSPLHKLDIFNSTATTSINLQGLNSTNAVTGLSFGRYWDGGSSYRSSSIFHYLTPGSLDVMAFAVAGTGGTNINSLQPSQIKMVLEASGKLGIGTTTPSSPLQVTVPTANATTSIEVGKSGQNKGSCLVMYDDAGTVQYVSISGGALVVSATSCK